MTAIPDLLRRWDFFEEAIIRHGFTEYNRDYWLEVSFYRGKDDPPHSVYYLFRGCVETRYESRLNSVSAQSLRDDRFVDYLCWDDAGRPQGIVWGLNYAEVYPGWTYVEESERAADWSRKLGIPMHEIVIDTNLYRLSIIFHDLEVTSPTGWQPYTRLMSS